MLKIFTVAFFGHRSIDNFFEVKNLVEKQVKMLIDENEYVDFLVGRNGEFDLCVGTAIKGVKENYYKGRFSLVLVLPYLTAEYEKSKDFFDEYYDDIEICYDSARAFPKNAITVRNKKMVDRADLIICYIENQKGGAYRTVKYAIKQGKAVINLAKNICNN